MKKFSYIAETIAKECECDFKKNKKTYVFTGAPLHNCMLAAMRFGESIAKFPLWGEYCKAWVEQTSTGIYVEIEKGYRSKTI